MKNTMIFIVNIICILAVFLISDYFISKYEFERESQIALQDAMQHNKFEELKDIFQPEKFHYSLKLIPFSQFYQQEQVFFESLRRKIEPADKENEKKPIIVFGCSFAYGALLEDTDTFEYKLSRLTNRTVYNRAFQGFGISPMLWMLRQDKFYEDLSGAEPEYVIYVYYVDHLRRIFYDKYGLDLNVWVSFDDVNNHLVESTPKDLYLTKFQLYKKYKKYIIHNKIFANENKDINFDLLKLYFEESRKELQKRYPNIKFIIIKHPCSIATLADIGEENVQKYTYITPRWKELEDEGFIVYDLLDKLDVDITSNEYTFPDSHPNEKAWDVVTKKLVEDLNL